MKKLTERKRNRLSLVRMWRFQLCVCGDINNRENVGNQVEWLRKWCKFSGPKESWITFTFNENCFNRRYLGIWQETGWISSTLSDTQMLGILPLRLALTDGDIFLSKGFLQNVLSGSGGTYDSTKEDEVKKVPFQINFTDNFYITVNFV